MIDLELLIGSKWRVKILQHFFENPKGEFFMREIAREIGTVMNNVRPALHRLEKIGVLRKETVGRRYYYSLNNTKFTRDLSVVFGYNLQKND